MTGQGRDKDRRTERNATGRRTTEDRNCEKTPRGGHDDMHYEPTQDRKPASTAALLHSFQRPSSRLPACIPEERHARSNSPYEDESQGSEARLVEAGAHRSLGGREGTEPGPTYDKASDFQGAAKGEYFNPWDTDARLLSAQRRGGNGTSSTKEEASEPSDHSAAHSLSSHNSLQAARRSFSLTHLPDLKSTGDEDASGNDMLGRPVSLKSLRSTRSVRRTSI